MVALDGRVEPGEGHPLGRVQSSEALQQFEDDDVAATLARRRRT